MFCTKCGTPIPEGGSCPKCNPVVKEQSVETQVTSVDAETTPVEAQEPMAETQEQSIEAPTAPVYQAPPMVKLKKGKYISRLAPTTVKTFSIVGLVATLLAIVFFVSCYFSFMNISIEEIPIVKIAFAITDTDIDESLEEIDETSEKLDDIKKEAKKQGYDNDFFDAFDEVQESYEDLSDSFSLKNMNAFFASARDFSEVCEEYEDFDDDLKLDMDDYEELEMFDEWFDIISYIAIGLIAFCAIFTLFGGFFKKTGLVITGTVLTLFSSLIMCSTLLLALGFALHVIIIVSNIIVNSSYKKYKKSF